MSVESNTDSELHSLFSKLLSLLNLKFGNVNICGNCCRTLESISEQLERLQTDVRQLQRVVSQGFEGVPVAPEQKRCTNELSLKEHTQESSSTEDEITGFSQEQTLLSPTGSFRKRFSGDSPKKSPYTTVDGINRAVEQDLLAKKSTSKDDCGKRGFEDYKASPRGRRSSECAESKHSAQRRNAVVSHSSNRVLEPQTLEEHIVQKPLAAANTELSNFASTIDENKSDTPETRYKHKCSTEDASNRGRKVARGRVNSQKFGKVSRTREDNYDYVSFSQTPSPKKEATTYETKEKTERILEQLSKEDGMLRSLTEHKDNNGNKLCVNPIIRSREERMKVKGSTCTECQKTWRCLAHNDEVNNIYLFPNEYLTVI